MTSLPCHGLVLWKACTAGRTQYSAACSLVSASPESLIPIDAQLSGSVAGFGPLAGPAGCVPCNTGTETAGQSVCCRAGEHACDTDIASVQYSQVKCIKASVLSSQRVSRKASSSGHGVPWLAVDRADRSWLQKRQLQPSLAVPAALLAQLSPVCRPCCVYRVTGIRMGAAAPPRGVGF